MLDVCTEIDAVYWLIRTKQHLLIKRVDRLRSERAMAPFGKGSCRGSD